MSEVPFRGRQITPVQQAVNDLSRHFAVLPISLTEKKPVDEGGQLIKWKPYQERRPTNDELRRWFAPDRNIAVICGQISGGLCILDIDNVKLADEVSGDIPLRYSTSLTRSPRVGGGLHVWCIETQARTRSEDIDDVGELKAEGSLVLVPPSKKDGRPYTYISSDTIAVVPDARVYFLEILRAFDVTPPPPQTSGPLPEILRAGHRHKPLLSLAGSMRRRGASVAAILAALEVTNAERCDPPLEQRWLEQIANSMERYPAGDEVAPNRRRRVLEASR